MIGSRSTKLPFGIPGLLYLEFLEYGRGDQKHNERRIHLRKSYAYIRGFLAPFYTKKNKTEEYNEKIYPLLDEVKLQIGIMNKAYNPSFEGMSCGEDEKKFEEIMDGVFERLVYISAVSEMIENQRADDETLVVG